MHVAHLRADDVWAVTRVDGGGTAVESTVELGRGQRLAPVVVPGFGDVWVFRQDGSELERVRTY